MYFAPIVPTKVLPRYLTGRKVWFALAYVQDPDYWKFYMNATGVTTIILDNGAWEGKMDFNRLKIAMDALKPILEPHPRIVVVLPDILLGNWKKSAYLSLGGLEQLYDPMYEFMYVPQAEPRDELGVYKSIELALEEPRITWIGLPRCWATDFHSLMRVEIAMHLKRDKKSHLKVHALGMADGNLHELYYLARSGVISVDSSRPVWRSFTKPGDIDFSYNPHTDLELQVADDKIAEVDLVCQTPSMCSGVPSNTTGGVPEL